MSLANYSELKTAVGVWLARDTDTSFTDYVADFIALAESRMWKELRVRAMLTRSTSILSTEFQQLPADFIEQRTIKIGDNVLDFMVPDRMERTAISNTEGTPKSYTIVGDEFQFAPTPDTSYTVEIAYFKRLTSLSDANTTNWILTNAPELYLYGSLMESEAFLGADQRVSLWSKGYANALAKINKSERDGRFGTAPVIWSENND